MCIFPLFLCLQHLWKLLVEESNLVGHLQVCESHFTEVIVALHEVISIYLCSCNCYLPRVSSLQSFTKWFLPLSLQTVKNFFLLGRGELYLAFVDLAQAFMTLPPTATTEHGTASVRLWVREGLVQQLEHAAQNLPLEYWSNLTLDLSLSLSATVPPPPYSLSLSFYL